MKITTLTDLLFPFIKAPAVALAQMDRWAALLRQLDEALPQPDPLASGDKRITGYLFDEGPTLVEWLIAALREHPELFAGSPDPQVLWLRQRCATGWRALNLVLRGLADRTALLYQVEQAGTNRLALEILRRFREAARGPLATAVDRERAQRLGHAETALASWQRRKGGK